MLGFRPSGDPTEDLATTARAQLLALQLAQVLAERLDAVVPRPITVAADQDWVVVRDGQTPDWRRGVEPTVGELGAAWEHVGMVVWTVLNSVQDFIIETNKHPWPPVAGKETAKGTDLPMPWVRVEDDRVRLGYGDPDQPALELPAILRQDLVA
jgi:hypothetical protein